MQRLADSRSTEVEHIDDASAAAVVRKCWDAENVTHHLVKVDIAQSIWLLTPLEVYIVHKNYRLIGELRCAVHL